MPSSRAAFRRSLIEACALEDHPGSPPLIPKCKTRRGLRLDDRVEQIHPTLLVKGEKYTEIVAAGQSPAIISTSSITSVASPNAAFRLSSGRRKICCKVRAGKSTATGSMSARGGRTSRNRLGRPRRNYPPPNSATAIRCPAQSPEGKLYLVPSWRAKAEIALARPSFWRLWTFALPFAARQSEDPLHQPPYFSGDLQSALASAIHSYLTGRPHLKHVGFERRLDRLGGCGGTYAARGKGDGARR